MAPPSKRILLIEDEQDVVDLLTMNLRKSGGQGIVRPNCSKTNLPAGQNQTAAPVVKTEAPQGSVPK